MSQQHRYSICCPQCAHQDEIELFDSLNVSEDPTLRDQLMGNRINAVTCQSCGFEFRVDKPLLYNDPGHNIMIYWIPTSLDQHDKGVADFRRTMTQMTSAMPQGVDLPEIHLVFTRTELVERVFLREAGLNERIIEYIKYLIYVKNIDKVSPEDKALLFNAEDSNDDSLCFVVQDSDSNQLESVFEYSRKAYDGICEMFDQDDQTATLLELFPGPHMSARSLLLSETEVPEF